MAPAEVAEQLVIISGVKASISDNNNGDVSFGSAAVPDQMVIGVLQSRRSKRSSCDPLQILHCILKIGVTERNITEGEHRKVDL